MEKHVTAPADEALRTLPGDDVRHILWRLADRYGITEDCPGFLGQKWMDARLEATYEGPEAVQRRQLSFTMTNDVFLARYRGWIAEMRAIGERRPGTGACVLATAMELWLWTLEYLQRGTDALGVKLYQSARQGVTFPLADALCWLVATRCQILDVIELEAKGPEHPAIAEGLAGYVRFLSDLCHVQAARAGGEVGRITAELVYGYGCHPDWDTEGCASNSRANDLELLDSMMPGTASTGGTGTEVIESDGSRRPKARSTVQFKGMDEFARLRATLDECLTGSRTAKDRAAESLTKVMIPEALDY